MIEGYDCAISSKTAWFPGPPKWCAEEDGRSYPHHQNNLDSNISCKNDWLVGWLFWVYRPFETVFQSISGRPPKRGRKRRERTDERKMSKQPPPAPIASAIGPCPTIIQISRTPRHWKFTQRLHTTRPPPCKNEQVNKIHDM